MAASIETLLTKIKTLPDVKQRSIAAVLGAIVADAATTPLHWIYNQDTLDNIITANKKQPEFWPENKCPFYTLPSGHVSGYSEQTLTTLVSLDENKGNLDVKHVSEAFKKRFGAGSDYADALEKRKTAGGKPVVGPWIQKGVIMFLENYAKGELRGDSGCREFDGFCASLPVIAMHAGGNVWDEASKVSHLLSTDGETTKIFHTVSLLVNGFITAVDDPISEVGKTIATLYPDVSKLIEEVEEAKAFPFVATVAKFGKACSMPGSFQGALLAMLQTSSFVDAVRLNITAGGCNCSRANVIGACYAAKDGIDGIPLDWLKKVKDIEVIVDRVIRLLQ